MHNSEDRFRANICKGADNGHRHKQSLNQPNTYNNNGPFFLFFSFFFF